LVVNVYHTKGATTAAAVADLMKFQ